MIHISFDRSACAPSVAVSSNRKIERIAEVRASIASNNRGAPYEPIDAVLRHLELTNITTTPANNIDLVQAYNADPSISIYVTVPPPSGAINGHITISDTIPAYSVNGYAMGDASDEAVYEHAVQFGAVASPGFVHAFGKPAVVLSVVEGANMEAEAALTLLGYKLVTNERIMSTTAVKSLLSENVLGLLNVTGITFDRTYTW